MKKEKAIEVPRTIEITGIAIDPSKAGLRGELYGVAKDGRVYRYDAYYQSWRILSDLVFVAPKFKEGD